MSDEIAGHWTMSSHLTSTQRHMIMRGSRFLLPYLGALLYFAFVIWVQPGYRLSEVRKTFYDDYDWTAVALRTLNAARGRVPGLQTDPCGDAARPAINQSSINGHRALKPRYFLEYPIPVVWLFSSGFIAVPEMKTRDIPAEFLDACQGDILGLEPKTELQFSVLRGFRLLIRAYVSVALLCLVSLIAVLHGGYKDFCLARMPDVLFLLPAFLYFSLNRFDIVPTLLMALSLACLSRGYLAASGAFLAAGAITKVFPVFLAPLILRYLAGNRQKALLWGAGFSVTALGMLAIAIGTSGVSATLAPFTYQLSRPLEVWTIYGSILPSFLGTEKWGWFRSALEMLAILAMCWRPFEDLASLLRRGAVVLIIFISLQVFFSPQWIVWLVPFLVPLACIRRSFTPWVIAVDLVMFVSFPLSIGPLHHGLIGAFLHTTLLYLRIGVLASIVFLLIRWDRKAERRDAFPL